MADATVGFETTDDEGEEIVVELPAVWVVCSRCRGNGKHVDPRVDGDGFTSEEMSDMGEDFREDYLSGRFDVTCEECGGMRVVAEVDRVAADPKLLAAYDRHNKDLADDAAERAAERRMGA